MTRLLQLATLKYRDAVIEDLDYRVAQRSRPLPAREPRLLRVDPLQPKRVDPRRHRQRQDLPRVRTGAPGLPAGLERVVRARAAAVRGAQPLPCRRQLPQAPRRHRQNQLLIIDDFAIAPIGPRERNDLLELLDDRVGSRAMHRHQSITGRALARLHRRSHSCRRDPGSPHPPRAPDPSRGKESMRKREAAKLGLLPVLLTPPSA